MNRRPMIAGNWKMHLTRAGSVTLAQQIAAGLGPLLSAVAPDRAAVEVVVCPPYVYLDPVIGALRDTPVRVGAQNVFWEASGAFTGEISPQMLKDLGCQYVIVGHSERRHLLGEKVRAALDAGLTPIVCVGEKLEQRQAGQTRQVLHRQFEAGLAWLSGNELAGLVIAYEPVWAIGTGQVATPQQAQEVHTDLRNLVRARYNDSIADGLVILYGGSVAPDNAGDLLRQPDVDGALVGGASLAAERCLAIVQAALEAETRG